MQKLLQKNSKVIVPSVPEKSEFVSPNFTVPKPDGGIRLILNLKTEGCFMASFDLKDAYFSVKIHEDYQQYLKFRWKNILYKFRCYPNGLGPCPRRCKKLIRSYA